MYNNSANEMLLGGGITSAKFEAPGTTITGTIAAEPEVQQQRDFRSGEALFWDDGKPRQQIRVILDTEERDSADPYDDGQRALYIKSGLMKAVRTAIRMAGAKGLEVGGKLTVTYTGNGEAQRGGHPPKIYLAVYESPAAPAAVEANALLNGGPAYETASTTSTAPAAQPAQQQPAPQAAGATSEQAAAIAQLTPQQRAALGL